MPKTIQIEIRNVYGKPIAYPWCGDAETFARIAGTKTLTRATLRNVFQLGFTVVEVNRVGRHVQEFRPERAEEQYELLATRIDS